MIRTFTQFFKADAGAGVRRSWRMGSLMLSMYLHGFLLLLIGLWTNQSFAQTIINTSGTYTVPAGVTSITVMTWGGGGGGGGGNSGCTQQGVGSGGGGGGFAQSTLAVTPGEVYTVTIGAGGAAGANNANGGAGGTTIFTGPGGTISATGGGFGIGASSCAVAAGGAGGTGTGTITYSGAAGGSSVYGAAAAP